MALNPLLVLIAPAEGTHRITLTGDMMVHGDVQRPRRNLSPADARDLARQLLFAAEVVDPKPAPTLVRLDLDAIEARAAAATPAPWVIEKTDHRWSDSVHYALRTAQPTGTGINPASPSYLFWMHGALMNERPRHLELREVRDDAGILADATFVVAARVDVPALVAELRRARTALKSVLPYAERWAEADGASSPIHQEIAAAREVSDGG